MDACVNQGIVWSLEESGDGWDDVRQAVIQAKKDRKKALEDAEAYLAKYGAPAEKAGRWAKVIAAEVAGANFEGVKLDVKVRL